MFCAVLLLSFAFVVIGLTFCVSSALLVLVLMVFEFCSLVGWPAEWRQVLPSEWGTAQKPWFIFTKSYWCPGIANRLVAREKRLLLIRRLSLLFFLFFFPPSLPPSLPSSLHPIPRRQMCGFLLYNEALLCVCTTVSVILLPHSVEYYGCLVIMEPRYDNGIAVSRRTRIVSCDSAAKVNNMCFLLIVFFVVVVVVGMMETARLCRTIRSCWTVLRARAAIPWSLSIRGSGRRLRPENASPYAVRYSKMAPNKRAIRKPG